MGVDLLRHLFDFLSALVASWAPENQYMQSTPPLARAVDISALAQNFLLDSNLEVRFCFFLLPSTTAKYSFVFTSPADLQRDCLFTTVLEPIAKSAAEAGFLHIHPRVTIPVGCTAASCMTGQAPVEVALKHYHVPAPCRSDVNPNVEVSPSVWQTYLARSSSFMVRGLVLQSLGGSRMPPREPACRGDLTVGPLTVSIPGTSYLQFVAFCYYCC